MARFVLRSCERRVHLGAVVATYPGETVCGDGWSAEESPLGPTLLVVDGLGHGPHAAHAATIAIQVFAENQNQDCAQLAETIHRALAPTRGAALAVARIDAAAQAVRFVGIGNIAAAVVSGGEVRRMISNNGTAGHVAPRIQEYSYPYLGQALVILHSDGISARWDLATYPGLVASHPSLVAGVIYRDLQRGRDDATIVAMRSAA
jgi:hypothetical protein